MEQTVYVKKITVENFKAIIKKEIELNNSTIIVTGSNDSGKSSILQGLFDRFKKIIPTQMVHKDTEKGYYEMELSDGAKIIWRFNSKGNDSLTYVLGKIRVTSGVISMLNDKYFGKSFDIEKFLNVSEKEQVNMLLDILGVDFSKIDEEYKVAYNNRADAKRRLKDIIGRKLEKPKEVKQVNTEILHKKLQEINEHNEKIRKEWSTKNEKHLKEIREFNERQRELGKVFNKAAELTLTVNQLKKELAEMGYSANFAEIKSFLNTRKRPEVEKELTSLPEPKLKSTDDILKQIMEANAINNQYHNYKKDLELYNNWVKEGQKARDKVDKYEKEVREILQKKSNILKNAKLPEEFEIKEDGVYYKGYPFKDSQISTSAKYIAALKLGMLGLNELKAMHFEASALDEDNLKDVLEWSNKNKLQLLIEKPEKGDIQYKVIEK